MKKLLLLVFVLFSASNLFASHLMGGQITASQLSGNQYLITVTEYRDTTGIPITNTAIIYYNDATLAFDTNHYVPHTGAATLFNGVEYYQYIDTVTFPGPGVYTIHTYDCCRNYAIINMANPGGEEMYLSSELTVYASGSNNSTPEFLNHPATLAQKNSLFQYNPLPFDADGDSLVWSLETPLGSMGDTVAGYFLPLGASSNPFTLNSVTGEITWMPDSNGNWEASFRIEEYRSGVKIGEIRRDMQIIVVDDTTNYNQVVINHTGWSTDGAGNYLMNLTVNQPFYLNISGTDADMDMLNLNVFGQPMLFASNAAQVTVTSGPGYANGYFTWTPDITQVNANPYTIVARFYQYHLNSVFTTDQTILLRVSQTTGIKDATSFTASSIYPNPSTGQWYLPFELKATSNVKVELFDATGRMVQQLANELMPAGMHLLANPPSALATGYYTVRMTVDNQQTGSYPLIIK